MNKLNATDRNLMPLFDNKNGKVTDFSEEIDINNEDYLFMEKDGRNLIMPKPEHVRESVRNMHTQGEAQQLSAVAYNARNLVQKKAVVAKPADRPTNN